MAAHALLRQALLFAHTVAFAIALSAVLREDLAWLRARTLSWERIEATARTLVASLALLWATGIALIVSDTGLDPGPVLANPKLVAKLLVVALLTLNGVALHTIGFPMLRHRHAPRGVRLVVPVVLGAVSSASWLYASFIGVSRLIAPAMNLVHFTTLYALLLVLATVIALVFVRPRVAQRWAAPGKEPGAPSFT